MRAPEFAAYIAPAKQNPQIWRLICGVLLILFCYGGFGAMMVVGAFPVLGPMNFFGWLNTLQAPATPASTVFLLATFAGLWIGVFVAAPTCHGRSPTTIFGPRDETLRTFFVTFATLIPIYAVMGGIGWVMAKPVPNMVIASWVKWLPFALILILVQTSAEEMLFRGYLKQQLAARFVGRWIWMGLPALIFTSLHYNPAAGTAIWPMLIAIFGFSLIAADLTEQTGSLGAAMAFHFLNNVNALLFVSVDQTITGLALFKTPFTLAESGSFSPMILLDMVVLFVVWRILRFTVCR